MNALDLIDQQLAKAAQSRSRRGPTLLYLKEGLKASIRPLAELHQTINLRKHDKYSEYPEERVSAICASEEKKQCLYCQMAKDDKMLASRHCFYLPIFVNGVIDQRTGILVTYDETQEDGSKIAKPMRGVRVLELSAYGKIKESLKVFREFVKDQDNCKITECDWNFSQSGVGSIKSYITTPKAPKPVDAEIKEIISSFSRDEMRARIINALPPCLADSHRQDIANGPTVVSEDIGEDTDLHEW